MGLCAPCGVSCETHMKDSKCMEKNGSISEGICVTNVQISIDTERLDI